MNLVPPIASTLVHEHERLSGVPGSFTLRERDDRFVKLQEQIEAKEAYLMEKQRKLCRLSKQNAFLNGVREDYAKYHQHIIQDRENQRKALEILDAYLSELTESGELSENNIKDAKEEQAKILRELDKVKGKLDKVIQDTQYVHKHMNRTTK